MKKQRPTHNDAKGFAAALRKSHEDWIDRKSDVNNWVFRGQSSSNYELMPAAWRDETLLPSWVKAVREYLSCEFSRQIASLPEFALVTAVELEVIWRFGTHADRIGLHVEDTRRILSGGEYLRLAADTRDSLFHLHRRHSESVLKVMADQMAKNSLSLVKATLPDTCLVRMIGANVHLLDRGEPKAPLEGPKKHGKGKLNEEVKRLLDLHPDWTAVKIADTIETTTSEAVRKTTAWKQRSA